MGRRFVSVWFYQLLIDWQLIRKPELSEVPFVFVLPDHGNTVVTAVSPLATDSGVTVGMRGADAKAVCPGLQVLDDKPGRAEKLLRGIGQWCIRYSPIVAVDEFGKDGLFIDASGCTHLWGGEKGYLKEIVTRLHTKGYAVRCAMADTPGAAWGVSRFGKVPPVVPVGRVVEAIAALPPVALRLEETTLAKLGKLGFYQVKSFLGIPKSVLRRRFGESFLLRVAQALGTEAEVLIPLQVPVAFRERLHCMEPIRTREGIELAIKNLLSALCKRMGAEGKGLRKGTFTGYRLDGKLVQVAVGTSEASHSVSHLFDLLSLKIDQIRPGMGIELFELEANHVDGVEVPQEALWDTAPGLNNKNVLQLIDRVAGKIGPTAVHRYVPASRYWPERSISHARSVTEVRVDDWQVDKPRPTELLEKPEAVQVMALVPDHPPRFFIYKGEQHRVIRADGPERIEREWWIDEGEHRDYYRIEDDKGHRFWMYRSGHYDDRKAWKWFLHGFFA